MWQRMSASIPSKPIPVRRPLPPPRPASHPRRHISLSPPLPSRPHHRTNDPPTTSPALRHALESIEQQTLEADRLRALAHPAPWYSLLRSPGRAAWRSSSRSLPTRDDEAASPLSQTRFDLIQRSGRTNRQLQRTYGRVVEGHRALAIKRERERRTAADLSRVPPRGEGGNLEDVRGRRVGSWNERREKESPLVSCDDPFVSLLLSYEEGRTRYGGLEVESNDDEHVQRKTRGVETTEEIRAMYRTKKRAKLIASAATAPESGDGPVAYGPEQTVSNLKYRFLPNYSIVERVLSEVQSLLGGVNGGHDEGLFRPKRVLDFGSGVGSSSAAALNVFGVSKEGRDDSDRATTTNANNRHGIEWVHSIDVSRSMRDATEGVLKSVLEGVPWGYHTKKEEEEMDEELETYERILSEIKGGVDERSLERRRQRLLKWEQSWEVRKDYRTRLTFGESIVDSSSFYSQLPSSDEGRQPRPDLPWQKQLNQQRQKAQEKKEQEEEKGTRTASSQMGSFDLILCTYTLSELSSVTSTLTATALLWEKLAPGGVMVFVEPGTPDGFSTLRSVRSMLLECFPPREIRNVRAMEEKRLLTDRLNLEEGEEEKNALRKALEELENGYNDWAEECQVIAPCTHNGQCPMSRHQKNHVKTNTRFGKYEMASDTDTSDEMESLSANGTDDYSDTNHMDENEHGTEEEEERLMKELVDQGYDREELEEMMRLMGSLEEDDDEDEDASDSDDEFSEDDNDNEGDDFLGVDVKTRSSSTMARTDVFESSFCSFVHTFPGGTSRQKGEKFSYLVVQKRTPSYYSKEALLPKHKGNMLKNVDIVDMLAKSVHHVQGLKEELIHMSKLERRKDGKSSQDLYENSHHVKQLRQILDKAVQLENELLESTKDRLGMDLLHGDDRRRGWGRLIRAPIKKKGHILLDYCSGGCTGKGSCGSNVDGAQGRIIRQKVSRAWSARVAPGCYAAARKARWGGLWPDLSERVA
ncbi:hypothetical protein ACHAWX_004137 [Stephanocyclus meneghinianus]